MSKVPSIQLVNERLPHNGSDRIGVYRTRLFRQRLDDVVNVVGDAAHLFRDGLGHRVGVFAFHSFAFQ